MVYGPAAALAGVAPAPARWLACVEDVSGVVTDNVELAIVVVVLGTSGSSAKGSNLM